MQLDTITQAEALEFMRGLADSSVDAVITDPPYFKVKPDWWDHQWDDRDSFVSWVYELALEWQRVLKPNGSLYMFASPQMAARVEVEIGKLFNVLNSLVWYKTTGNRNWSADKEQSRGFLPNTERIIFAEHFNSDNHAIGAIGEHYFQPIQQHIRSLINGKSIKDLALKSGLPETQVSHYLRQDANGWRLPDQFALDRMGINESEKQLKAWREDLRREYEDLRRPFNITADDQFTDVWLFKPVQSYDGKHPTEKPLALMKHIISASTKPGAIILDPFAGSGTTCDAARQLGRHYTGCDLDPHWAEYARHRLAQSYTPDMFDTLPKNDDEPDAAQLDMFK